jgi:small subunit ribosomal protein S4
LFLKGDRCQTEKCSLTKRNYVPGQHGQDKINKMSDYGVHLREKQKVKRMYCLQERQFRNYFTRAERMQGITGENLLQLLERRLDNVVYRLGFAASRRLARQLVRHGHFLVNNRSVDTPAFIVRTGDTVQVKERSRQLEIIHATLKKMTEDRLVPWLEIDKVNLKGAVKQLPKREDIQGEIQENLIVEFYSK